jgi:hypothetical protein
VQASGSCRVKNDLRGTSTNAAIEPILGATSKQFFLSQFERKINTLFLILCSQIQCSTVEEVVSVDIGQLARMDVEGTVLYEAVGWISPVHLEFPILRARNIFGASLKIKY